MRTEELLNWIRKQQPTLDHIIARAGEQFHEHHKMRPNFAFDLGQCQAEACNLSRKPPEDLCYDRPTTPLTYSLWYHGRRVNTFLSHFANTLLNTTDDVVEIFDLGAGTGAVQWGIGLVYHCMKDAGMRVPRLKIVNVDTSPFMLQYSRQYLWKNFLQVYAHCQDFDNPSNPIEYHVNAWGNIEKQKITNAWITASYLFDISDNTTTNYRQEALEGFQQILKQYNPSRLLLLTAESKKDMMKDVARQFPDTDYIVNHLPQNELLLHGQLDRVNELRQYLFKTYQPSLQTELEQSIKRNAGWDDISFSSVYITKKQTQIFDRTQYDGALNLHNVPIKARIKVELNSEQQRAARNINQPTVIIGPAGCGKSIVLTERIRKIVEESRYPPRLSILISTFNKELVGQLAQWLAEILDPTKFSLRKDVNYKYYDFYFNRSRIPNIRIINFDMLPKILGHVPYYGGVNRDYHFGLLEKIVGQVKVEYQITDGTLDDILNAEFLFEEYNRVIYGLQIGLENVEDYLSVSRKGRGTRLDRNKREIVWQCLKRYRNHITTAKVPCFTERRQELLRRLRKGNLNVSYDYIAIDEFQDCTKADFELFFAMLKDPDHLVVAGDLAQALQLGRSANVELLREAIRQGRKMNDISWNYLNGSYRLPLRICEAVKKISEHIHLSFKRNSAASILIPYKGAPPGARPIIVYGVNTEEVAKKNRQILNEYKLFELDEITILEEDVPLANALGIPGDSVLRLKGLERHCVIWSTRTPVKFKKERFEFVHTILSRTSSILIIALFEEINSDAAATQNIFKEAIGLLRKDRLIFWDKDTKEHFDSFCAVPAETETDDD